jgi:cell division protein FtsI/penicillin-binding protein 2
MYKINKVDITDEYYQRILTGLNKVITNGTARGYIFNNDGAGKTGTSETLVDTNNDNIYETKTISTSFMGFMPYNNPVYTFIIISPNISSNKVKNGYYVPINRYIIHDLTKILFENI